MYVFFAIIFIAELIIAGFIIYWLRKFDSWALITNEKVLNQGPMLIEAVQKFRISVLTVLLFLRNSKKNIEQKKKQLKRRIFNIIVVYLLFYILKVKFKKAATFYKYALFLKDGWDSIPA